MNKLNDYDDDNAKDNDVLRPIVLMRSNNETL